MAVIFSYVAADIVVAIATCLVAVYLYFTNAYKYWKRRGVHYIQPTSLLGNFGDVIMLREHLGVYLKRVYDDNPSHKVVGLFALKQPILLVRDLNVVRDVLVKDAHSFLDRSIEPSKTSSRLLSRGLFFLKGWKWRHMRIKLTPTFTSGKIKKMFYLINECGKQLLPCIDKEMAKGKCDVKDTVARYSTDVIASCAFGVNANALADPNCEFRSTMRKFFERTRVERFYTTLTVLAPWLIKLFGGNVYDETVDTYARKTFWDVVDYRKKNNIVRKDFVDILMTIKDEGEVRPEDANDLEEIKQDNRYNEIKNIRNDKVNFKLEDDDFVGQALIFIAAGFETSASVISFSLYELALNPTIQDKLRREIQTVLDKHNSEVTYEAIAEMEYLAMTVSEALRKYPTIPFLERKCLKDCRIPGSNIIIEKGTSVMIPVLAIHLDPNIYTDPDKFDPERFSSAKKIIRSHFAHIPFGEGPRICIGEIEYTLTIENHIAMHGRKRFLGAVVTTQNTRKEGHEQGMRFGQMQVKTVLVHILTSYKVRPCVETPQPPLGMKPTGGGNVPRKDIVLEFEKIK